MEAGGSVVFEKGRAYTREEIHGALGGSRRAALPTKGGKVVCLCLRRERNPRAPDEVVIGGHERSVRLARDLAASGSAVPVFVRAPRGGWEYAGERRVRAAVDEPGALLSLVAEGAPADASLALLLEEVPGEVRDVVESAVQCEPLALASPEPARTSSAPAHQSPAGG